MSKFFNSPTVGIDVSADFSYIAILAPNGDIFRKPFRINHNLTGFNYLLEEIKKVEREFNMKTAIFMESTGVYHLPLSYFLKNNFDNTFVINPLITKCNKNNDIRKVKNDKKDSISIAKIGKFQDIKYSIESNLEMYLLKSLTREYYKLKDTCSIYKKKLSTDLRIVFPNYNTVFRDTCSKSSLAILSSFPTPQRLLDASKDDVIEILLSNSRRSIGWCENIYSKLIAIASDAIKIGLTLDLSIKVSININLIKAIDIQIDTLFKEITTLIKSDNFSDEIKKNIELIDSIPGIGLLTAITIIAEIGDFKRFKKPKQLVAYFGLDASINESGKFKGTNNRMSKRGTAIGRRAVYTAALASIRTDRSGNHINKVLLDYYKNNMKGKAKKVALGALMHKLIKYIFSVLKNQVPYQIREPKLHNRIYILNNKNVA